MKIIDITNLVSREIDIIKKSLGGDLVQILEESEAVLAGGAITSLMTNKEISDYDIYFKNKKGFGHVLRDIFDLNKDSLISNFSVRIVGSTDKSIYTSYDAEEPTVQFVLFNLFERGAIDIFNSFDFTVCMFAYDFRQGRMYAHEDAMKHVGQRHLHFHEGTAFPLMSLLRFEKYREKGYKTSQKEIIKAALAVADVGYNDWKDLEAELSSMYGVDVSKMFDKEKPFSLSEAIQQISQVSVREVFLPNIPESQKNNISFEEFAEKFSLLLDDLTLEVMTKIMDAKKTFSYYGPSYYQVESPNSEYMEISDIPLLGG